MLPNVLFEEIGFTYAGPFDGHKIEDLIEIFEHAKHNVQDKPILIHVVTQKGRGYAPAEKNPEKFHCVGKFNVADGATKAEITIRLCLRTSFADLPKRIPALLLSLLQ